MQHLESQYSREEIAMSPPTTKTIFLLFVSILLLMFAVAVFYGMAWVLTDWSQRGINLEYGYSCAKLGLNCDKLTTPRDPSLGDIFLASFVGQTWTHHIVATAIFMAGGCMAYLCRCRAQVLYGFLEIFAALAFAAAFLYSINVQNIRMLSSMLGLLSPIYVVVRGLDNIEKGLAILPELHQGWRQFWFGQ
jgi:hypothetical protein